MRPLLTVVAVSVLLGACTSPAGSPEASSTPIVVGPGALGGQILPSGQTTNNADLPELRAVEIVSGLARPSFAISPSGDDRIFILEQAGVIRVLTPQGLSPAAFLDIREMVGSGGLEQGLLGLAFHPDYPADDRFFVHFTDTSGDSQVMSFRAAQDGESADRLSGEPVISVAQPASNHNGGMLAFGPDGYLYIGIGDGGLVDDVFGHGQRADTLLGTILRLDIDESAGYVVPPDNPFTSERIGSEPYGFYRDQLAEEVWAFGVRNPWRFDIDPLSGRIYVADVGETTWEEISVIEPSSVGANLGWSILEGNECFAGMECDPAGTLTPILTYGHDHGCAVTGGFVYRGSAIPELAGHFFFSDWCTGFIASIRYHAPNQIEYIDWSDDVGYLGTIGSFGLDGSGELLVIATSGTIWRLEPGP